MDEEIRQYSEGHFIGKWMGIWIVIFSGIGILLAIVLNLPWLITFAPAMGIIFGLAIGLSVESKYKKEGKIRPLTEDELKKRRILLIMGFPVILTLHIINFNGCFYLFLFTPNHAP